MPTFDAGTIDATLDLDRSPFSKGITAARQQAKRFEDRKFEVPLLLDRSQWDKTLLAVRAQRDRFEKSDIKPKLELDKGTWTRDLAAMRAQIKRLESNAIGIQVRVDGLGRLAALQSALVALPNRKVIDVEVNVASALVNLALLDKSLNLVAKSAKFDVDLNTDKATAKAEALRKVIGSAGNTVNVNGRAPAGSRAKPQEEIVTSVVEKIVRTTSTDLIRSVFSYNGENLGENIVGPSGRSRSGLMPIPTNMSYGGGNSQANFGPGLPQQFGSANWYGNMARPVTSYGGANAPGNINSIPAVANPFAGSPEIQSLTETMSRLDRTTNRSVAKTGTLAEALATRAASPQRDADGRVFRPESQERPTIAGTHEFSDRFNNIRGTDEASLAERKAAREAREREDADIARQHAEFNALSPKEKRAQRREWRRGSDSSIGDGEMGDGDDGGVRRPRRARRSLRSRIPGRLGALINDGRDAGNGEDAFGGGGRAPRAPRRGGGGGGRGGGMFRGPVGGASGQMLQGNLLQSRAMISGIATLLPLVGSGLGVAAGAAGALAAGLTAAAGVAAIGIAPIIGAATRATDALDKQKAAQEAVTKAEEALAAASTAEERTAAAEDLAAAQLELKAATDALTPGMLAFDAATTRIKDTWKTFIDATQDPAFGVMNSAMNILSDNMMRFAPLANLALGVFQGALDGVAAWFDGPESQMMLDFFATTGVASLTSFLDMGGNLLVFFGRLFDAFSPLAIEMMDGLAGMTAGWADWAGQLKDSEGFLTFLDWVRDRGGQFLTFFGSVWDALVNIGVALDPVAEVLLTVFTGLFDWIAGIDPGVLGAFTAGILAATIAFGAMGAAIALVTIIMNANPISLIVMAIAGLVAGLIYAYNHIDGFRNVVDTVWAAIRAGALWVWDALKQVWEWMKIGWEFVSNAFVSVWENVLQPAFLAVGSAMSWVWNSILKPVWDTIVTVFSALGATISWIVNSVIGPVFELFGAIARLVWDSVLQPVFGLVAAGFALVGSGIEWVWNNVISPVINFLGAGFQTAWNVIISPIFEALKGAWALVGTGMQWTYDNIISPVIEGFKTVIGGLGAAFDIAVAAVKTAWDKMSDIVKVPIRFVVDTLINKGLVDNFNKVARFFGTSEIPQLQLPSGFDTSPTASAGGGGTPNQAYASGGVTSGFTPGRDVHHFTSPTGGNLALSGGEAIMVPEWTRAVGGPAAVAAMNHQARHGGSSQAFAGGGVWDNITDAASNVASTVTNFVGGAIDFVTDPVGFLKASIDSLMGPIADNPFTQTAMAIPGKLVDFAKDKILGMFAGPDNAVTGGALAGIGAGSGGWALPSRGPLTSRFGPRWGAFHNGVDIAGGGATYAAANGIVKRTGNAVGYGNTGLGILLDHGGGLESYYGHNPVGGIKVAPGQTVQAGQHIGFQGATGNVTGIHLHHSIFQNGRAIDPIPFLSARGVSIGTRDEGGPMFPGWNMMYNGTGENELVLTGNQARNMQADMEEIRMMFKAAAESGQQPLVGGNLVLQARKDEDPSAQFERVIFQLQNGG